MFLILAEEDSPFMGFASHYTNVLAVPWECGNSLWSANCKPIGVPIGVHCDELYRISRNTLPESSETDSVGQQINYHVKELEFANLDATHKSNDYSKLHSEALSNFSITRNPLRNFGTSTDGKFHHTIKTSSRKKNLETFETTNITPSAEVHN
ncbi:hypothetical protein CEXT_761431 [Caerostris extrusa]|uniref:Uncharacterized protein n=1 Tax=Caerostris extrusa TaxID=172846 RepID=A0AAV4YE85_CAEEX|nr:hypothetical protein CEXT_761431 [Caerostris extrusa]